jgi:hypothetical protein
MTISINEHGIEIDHGDRDISAADRNGVIECMIGENYGDGSYENAATINMTIEEARAFRDWLSVKVA